MASPVVSDVVLLHPSVAFREGHVLRASMLDAATQASLDVLTAMVASYADGIVAGLTFARIREDLVLTPGLIKHTATKSDPQTLLFPSNVPINLSACVRTAQGEGILKNGTYKFVLRTQEPKVAEDIETYTLRLVLLPPEEEPKKGSDILLLRFRGSDGCSLKLPTELARCTHAFPVDFLDVPYATAMGTTTFSPEVFRLLRRALAGKEKRDVLDTSLLMQLSTAPVVPIATLNWYIDGKGISLSRDAMKDRETLLKICLLPAIEKTVSAPAATAASQETVAKPKGSMPRVRKCDDDW